MRSTDRWRARVGALAAGCIVAALAATAAGAAGFEERVTFDAEQLLLRDLVGQVRVEGHEGPAFEVEVKVQGADASRERVRLDSHQGKYAELLIDFPLDESRRYVYPRIDGKTHFSPDSQGGSWLSKLLGGLGGRVEVSGHGHGLEIWADVTVKVPRGASLKVEHGVGDIRAENVEGKLNLDIHSGPISAAGVTGRIVADTGSGSVSFEDVHGAIVVDTGSGSVDLARCEGEEINVDTGSGRVRIDSADSRRMSVDTGSGSIEARAVRADAVHIDTGSGSVTLQLDRMGRGGFDIDTGSGSIDLQLPPDASANVNAETGSGGIRFDLGEDAVVTHMEKGEAAVRVGDGDARVILDTGSGGIRVSRSL